MTRWTAPRWAWPVTLVLAVLGLADASFLTYAHFTSVAVLRCNDASSLINCAQVTTSAQSEIFGVIPVAVTGLGYFLVVTALMTPWAWRDERLRWPRLVVMVGGLGMIVYLVYAEFVEIHAICLYCTGVHVITFLLFLATLAASLLRPLPTVEEMLAQQGGQPRVT